MSNRSESPEGIHKDVSIESKSLSKINIRPTTNIHTSPNVTTGIMVIPVESIQKESIIIIENVTNKSLVIDTS